MDGWTGEQLYSDKLISVFVQLCLCQIEVFFTFKQIYQIHSCLLCKTKNLLP